MSDLSHVFLSQRHEPKFGPAERAALYSYLRDPGLWGISWAALVPRTRYGPEASEASEAWSRSESRSESRVGS